ncbi:MAG: hypothetical protein JSS65_10355 [Armatimonadetes bacterium]|nr:hypothetical protein [Armatimonadota bacterium]
MKRILAIVGVAVLLAGCGDTPPPNPEGPAAKSGKSYSREDAEKARPVRKGQGD